MNVLIFGATGMVGQGVLRECLLDPEVQSVAAVGRSASGVQNAKLREIVHADLWNYAAIENQLTGFDACFFCLGVSVCRPDGRSLRAHYLRHHHRRRGNFVPPESAHDVHLCLRRQHRQLRKRPHDVGARERQNGERAAAHAIRRRVHVPPRLYRADAWRKSLAPSSIASAT